METIPSNTTAHRCQGSCEALVAKLDICRNYNISAVMGKIPVIHIKAAARLFANCVIYLFHKTVGYYLEHFISDLCFLECLRIVSKALTSFGSWLYY